jgi:hypothetical protein
MAAVSLLVLASLASPPTRAAEPCRSPLTGFSVTRTDAGYTLEIEISNESDEQAQAQDFEFVTGPNTLRLQAVEAGNGNALEVPVALPSPNVENLVLKPGETFKQSFVLEGLILGLKEALTRTDVRLSWILDLDPKDACVSLSARGSALLKR